MSGARVRLTAPLRVRAFRLLWTGMAASLLGDGVLLVALAWQAYGLSNSPAAMSLVGVCLTVPFVPHSWAIFPEMPGALLVAWASLWLMQPVDRPTAVRWK